MSVTPIYDISEEEERELMSEWFDRVSYDSDAIGPLEPDPEDDPDEAL